jgi:putative ABC transport system substrate-binding protein
MKRREFITLFGGAAAWPLAARAQNSMPVVGWLQLGPSPMQTGQGGPAFLQALRENGFIEGRNLEFDLRWGPSDDLPALANELIRRRVTVIRAGGPPAVRAAMAATSTIPIVFSMGEDPVKEGVVASMSRPRGQRHRLYQFQQPIGRETGRPPARDCADGDDIWFSCK